MTTEAELKEKLRKIEALFAGAATAGERNAAQAARERIQARQREMEGREQPIEMRFSLGDGWNVKLFLALCRRYGLKPYRLHGQRRTTVMLKVVRTFSDEILWPEFTQLSGALTTYLNEATERIIHEEVFKDTEEPEERQG
ncbi:MAG: hypothetical protein WCL50_09465 [Spirochaetota bacterium]